MSFVRLGPAAARASTPGVVISLSCPPSGFRQNLRIRVDHDLATRLGWTVGGRVELLWGEDADAGRVLVATAQPGIGVKLARATKTATHSLAAYSATFGYMPIREFVFPDGAARRLIPTAKPASAAPSEVSGQGLEIQLPAGWWVSPEEAAKAPAGERPKKQAAPAPAPSPTSLHAKPGLNKPLWLQMADRGASQRDMVLAHLSAEDIGKALEFQRTRKLAA